MSKLKGHKGNVLTCCLHGCDQQVLLSGGEVRPDYTAFEWQAKC